MSRKVAIILVFLASFLGSSLPSYAQFKEGAFTQSYNDSTYQHKADSTDKLFSFKEYFGALGHKNTIKIGNMFGGSVLLPGTAQIYNKQYWKLPIIYGGIGVCAGLGGYYLHEYNKTRKAYDAYFKGLPTNTDMMVGAPPVLNNKARVTGTWLMVGAGLFYWGSLMDGVVNYHSDRNPLPGRATIYSILLPGLGQAYNGEYWKIPIY